jgi:hypothetical protein
MILNYIIILQLLQEILWNNKKSAQRKEGVHMNEKKINAAEYDDVAEIVKAADVMPDAVKSHIAGYLAGFVAATKLAASSDVCDVAV